MGHSGINHKWTAEEDALLGTVSDGDAARRIGLTPLSVFNRRKRLQIPGVTKEVPHPPYSPAKTRIRKLQRTPRRVKRRPRRPLPVPLSGLLDGKRIRDLSADEFLAVAREVNRLKRSGPRS